MVIYGSLQAEFMETKCKGHIHKCGTPIFGKIVIYISKPINNNDQILWRLQTVVIFDMPIGLSTSKAGLFWFCCIPCMINSRKEEV